LGFPRIGAQRELKHALEAYWAGRIDRNELEACGARLRAQHWQAQAGCGLASVPVGDFAWYDHILEWTTLLGAVPERFGGQSEVQVDLDTLFRMARGRAPTGAPATACEMTKWFDTNYHYIVPELEPRQTFRIARTYLFDQVAEALSLGLIPRPVIPGPLTWLWLGKGDAYPQGAADEGKLTLLDALLPVYADVLERLAAQGVDWVQIDEPILVLDLPLAWRQSFERAYAYLRESSSSVRVLLATYFGALDENLELAARLPVDGLHVDLVRAPEQLSAVIDSIGAHKRLSAGVVDGRNVWRTNLDAVFNQLEPVAQRLGSQLWLAPSCSLLHVPIDLELETDLDPDLRGWLAFARQKLQELKMLADVLGGATKPAGWEINQAALASRRASCRVHRRQVQERLAGVSQISLERPPFSERVVQQRQQLRLPLLPTTTIGSFPQTPEIRALRRAWKQGDVTDTAYGKAMRAEIANCIRFQEELGLDVLVHGEAERNDMVEYFGELLGGFAFTRHGWVQSYGSRCVKPPIIYGDVYRPAPMTVEWAVYAQALTNKPVKGMLTGPVTMLKWSFVRDDQPEETTCRQLALALRDEVADLENAGIQIIQIDEPAFREGLPLRQRNRAHYLKWAVDCFRLATSGVQPATQIHTHMCYSEFNDVIDAIAAMDADVITIETSRSNMELLRAFEHFHYPNEIGPGVYDIHSPNVPTIDWMVELIVNAAQQVPVERLWVNPDCGLKTRGWDETGAALSAMVAAAKRLRAILGARGAHSDRKAAVAKVA